MRHAIRILAAAAAIVPLTFIVAPGVPEPGHRDRAGADDSISSLKPCAADD